MSTAQRKTKHSFILSSLCDEPLFTVLALFSIILKKDLSASIFQISLLAMLRPAASLLSFYWGARSANNPQKIKQHLVVASFLQRAPFLLFPFIDNIWYFILSALIYALFQRAGVPALMEILKENVEKKEREKIFSLSSMLGYLEGIFIGYLFGWILNKDPSCWKLLFCFSALLSFTTVFLQSKLPLTSANPIKEEKKSSFIKPWKDSWKILKEEPDFFKFQCGFMLCGFGLMLSIPSIPSFVDSHNVSYLDLAISISVCKGIGYIASSPIWAKLLNRYPINSLTSALCGFFGLSILFLMLLPFHINWLYTSFVFYGIAQGGSHLIWNLSGPIFAGEKKSYLYSTVNVLTVGLRGVVGPLLGGLLFYLSKGPMLPFTSGMLLCFFSCWYMFINRKGKICHL